MNYKRQIEKLRKERGWTLHHMAVEADLNTSTVSNWFSRNSTPTTDALEKLCIAFGITMSEFFNETGEIVTLIEGQKELLKQWNCMNKNEKSDLLKFITTLNENKKKPL